VADDELHAVTREPVGDRDAFLGVGAVVADADRELLAEDTTSRVDVGDRLLDAAPDLRAEGGAAPILICACAVPASTSEAVKASVTAMALIIPFSSLGNMCGSVEAGFPRKMR
jgi:hypothetical protein